VNQDSRCRLGRRLRAIAVQGGGSSAALWRRARGTGRLPQMQTAPGQKDECQGENLGRTEGILLTHVAISFYTAARRGTRGVIPGYRKRYSTTEMKAVRLPQKL